MRAQWLKNVGNQVEVLTGDGRKLHGTLKAVGDEEFTLAVPTRVKPEGKKRPVTQDVDHTMRCDEIKYIKNIITILKSKVSVAAKPTITPNNVNKNRDKILLIMNVAC